MNSNQEKYNDYFEILELDANASLADITHAYKKLTELYSSESIVTDPIEDEFTLEERQEIVNQLEKAYKALLGFAVERDRVIRGVEKKEEGMEDTAKEHDEKEKYNEAEEEDIVELRDKERIKDDDTQEITVSEDDFNTKPAPLDLPEEIEEIPISVHENEYVHEEVHIDLPDKDDTREKEHVTGKKENDNHYPHENSLEIVSTHVDNDISEKKGNERKKAWDETLFEKDLKEIKKELTKELTKDIKAELTIVQKKPGDEPPEKERVEGLKIKGRSLRKIREKLGIGIHEIAVKTKINYKILVNIEKERFAKLPDAGHLRYYLTAYAKALFLDPHKVADEYMKRYRQWKRAKGEL